MQAFKERAVLILIALTFLLGTAFPAYAQTTGPWKPNLTHRPRLLWEQSDWAGILARLDREPYQSLYSRVKSRAGSTPGAPPPYYDASREYGVSNIAKNAAFVWAVENNGTYGEKAALILEESMATEFNWADLAGLFNLLDYDIHWAEAAEGYCAAFDILAGTGYLTGQRLQDIHNRLELMVTNAWNFYMVDWYLYRQVYNTNNHFTKMASAFGVAAITLNDSPLAREWIDLAMTWGTERLFEHTATPSGSYVEGPSYLVYSEVNFLPFFIYYDRFTGGESNNFNKRKCNLFGQNCTYTSVWVDNPLDDQRLYNMEMWKVKIRMPDGTSPPFDDSTQIGNVNGLFGSAIGDPVLVWDWVNMPGDPMYTMYCSDLTADFITTYDDSISPVEPAWGPSIIYQDDGYAIFREDWSEDSPYAFFMAEKGQAHKNGSMHEHADTLSFIYWAKGQMLAMDPGYIKWDERTKVRYGIDHNVVAIDGNGPPATVLGFGGNQGQFHSYDMDGDTPYAVGSTYFAGTDWTRAFIFYGDMVLIGDVLFSDKVRSYEFLLHGNGGGDTGGTFALNAGGANWQVNGVDLDLLLTATDSIAPDHWEDYHGWTWGQAHTHEVYSGGIAGKKGGFVAAVMADAAGAALSPTIINFTGIGCAGIDPNPASGSEPLVVSDGSKVCEFTDGNSFGIENGGMWLHPDENRALVFGPEAAFFVDGAQIAGQTGGGSMEVEWGEGWVEITSDAGEGNMIYVETGGPWGDVTGACVDQITATPFFTWVALNDVCTVRVEWPVGKVRMGTEPQPALIRN